MKSPANLALFEDFEIVMNFWIKILFDDSMLRKTKV